MVGKRKLPYLALAIPVLLLGILGAFNSCEGKFEANNKSCQPPGNLSRKLDPKLALLHYTSPFANGKVMLGQYRIESGGAQIHSKVKDNPITLPAGSQLAALVNTSCLEQKRQQGEMPPPLSVEVADGREILPGLDKQAFSFMTTTDLDVAELEAEAASDRCVVGISYNHKYDLHANYDDPGAYYQNHLASLHGPVAYDGFYHPQYGMPMNYNGREPIIAIVDTGVDYNHPDISSRMWRHQDGIGIDATTIGTALVDYNPMDNSPISHGTHVAGLAAAAGNNGVGVTGTMPFFAKIMAIRVFRKNGNNFETTSEIVSNGIRFAFLNGADVINLSLGRLTNGPDSDPFYLDAITEAVNADVVVVSAVGNATNSSPAQEVNGTSFTSLPAMYGESLAGMITVGSVDSKTNAWSSFSHYSTKYVEIGAPGAEENGTGLYSTVTPVAYHQNQLYSRLSGTSMSAPIVTGAAALVVGLLRNTFGVKPKASEVERLLTEGAIQDPGLTAYYKQGRRLDLEALIKKVHEDYPETIGNSQGFSSQGCP
ncbi:MAG: S8 family serine peptidase [Bdellovibrionaceae bacterium]|nr:S8 family serine peptidase [Bdellovibrionales bacterium]MCB9083552.1 S8 family serine peptidase [Pseudobdellovibrionaceae bacterium]